MNLLRATSAALAATLLLFVSSCGGSGSDAGNGLVINSCTLGCNNVGQGTFVCSFAGIHVNEEIRVTFSQPIKLSTVNKNSFKVTDSTGISPVGEYRIGDSPNQVVFRPVVTFDSSGNPVFGLEAGETYRIEILGKLQDPDGPWIESTSGSANSIRLDCFLVASQGVLDLAPGNPRVEVFVDQVTSYDVSGEPLVIEEKQANAGAELFDVFRDSEIRLEFDDIMNPATLTNPVTGKSDFIQVLIDPDGDTADISDQLTLFGTFLPPVLDNDALRTTLVYRLSAGMPSAGSLPSPADKRRVVVRFSSLIQDLGGNGLANPTPVTFVPEVLTFTEVNLPLSPSGLGERFLSTGENRDAENSAFGMWGATEDSAGTIGLLAAGPENPSQPNTYSLAPGGSGRLGSLTVESGETRVLNSRGRLTNSIENIPVTAVDSPFFNLVLVDPPDAEGTPTIEQVPLPAKGRVRWEQQQLFGIEPDWEALGFDGPPMMPVQIEAEDPNNPGEFSPVWIGNDGSTPLTLDVLVAQYSNTSIVDNYDPDFERPGTGFYSADDEFSGSEGLGADTSGADGVFEFSSILVKTGGRLRFTGERAVRLFARGLLDVRGAIDVSGNDASLHRSDYRLGQTGAQGGPGGGDGGKGGDRFDHGRGAFEFLKVDALPNAGTIVANSANNAFLFGIDNIDGADIDSHSGEGVGASAAPGQGAGPGSGAWPEVFPGETAPGVYTGLVADLGDLEFDFLACRSPQMSAPGGGGGYVPMGWGINTNGGTGVPESAFNVGFFPPVLPPQTGAGDTVGVDLATLDPELGALRGGSGGGGSGAHIQLTRSNGVGLPFSDCLSIIDPLSTPPLRVVEYSDHSGAAGGGGGGAIQVQAGDLVNLSGTIVALGGDGGAATTTGNEFEEYQRRAVPGGGGSGGAILLQGTVLQVVGIAGRLDVSGGDGGITLVQDTPQFGKKFLFGGDGGAGVARLEVPSYSTQNLAQLAGAMVSSDLIFPGGSQFPSPATYPEILSFGDLIAPTTGPGTFSGSQSCWMYPEGNFFQVDFRDDEFAEGGVLVPGWDVLLVFANGETISYRKVLTIQPFAGLTLEEVFGSRLRDPSGAADVFSGSPFVVRFQGARFIDNIVDPCDVELAGANSPVLAGSLTPWVYHPAELNDYWANVPGITTAQAAQRRPNMLRFQVIFDTAHPFASIVAGVTNLRVAALPD